MSAIKVQGETQARTVDRQSHTVETLVKTLQTERAKKVKRKLEKRVRKKEKAGSNGGHQVDVKELEMKLLQQLSVQDPPSQEEQLPPGGLKSPPELVGNPSLKEFARWESRCVRFFFFENFEMTLFQKKVCLFKVNYNESGVWMDVDCDIMAL